MMPIEPPGATPANTTWKILIIDDDEDDLILVREMLNEARGRKFEIHLANSYAAGRTELFSNHYHAVLVDYDLGMHSGIELIREANEQGYAAPLILYTGRGSYEVDIEAMQAGATLYLTKGETSPLMLERSIRYAIEHKQVEAALSRTEARWNAAIESFAEGAIIANEAEQVIYWNPAAREMHGFTRPDEGIEPLEKTPITFQLWTPDGNHKLELDEWPMRRIKRGETVRNLELRIRRPDQSWEKVFSYSGSMVDTAGGERLIFLTCHDLTEKRRAELALQESEERFRLALRNVPVSVAVQDRDLRYIWAYNQRSAKPEEIIGHTDQEIFTPQEAAHFTAIKRRVLEEGIEQHERVWLERPIGRTYLDICWEPIRDAAGNIVGVATATIDQTSLKLAEEELRASEQKYRNLFENMIEEVHFWQIVRDGDGGIRTWRLVDVNPPTLKTWGFASVDEIRGKTTDEIFGPGATEHYMPVVEKIMREGASYSYEDYFPNLDKYFRFTSVPFGDYFITTGADITRARHAEREMILANEQLKQQAEELEVQAEELQAQTDELLEANQKLIYHAGLLDNISEAAISTDAGFNLLSWNRAAESIYGWQADEALGKPFDAFLGTEYLDGASTADVLRQVQEQGFWMGEVRHRRRDGTRFYVAASITNLKNSAGKTTGVIAINRDISGQKAAEEELRQLLGSVKQEKARLQSVINNIPDEVWFVDTTGKLVMVNEQVMKEFGPGILEEKKARDIADQSEVYRPDGSVRLADEAPPLRALRGEYVRDQEEIVRTPATGELRFRQVNAVPVKDEHGTLLGSVSIVRDITEHKRAEEALLRSEASLKHAQEIAHLGSWELDLVNDRLTWSDEVYRMFGLQPQEFGATYEAFLDRVHPDDRRAVDDAYSGSLRDGRNTYEIEHRVVRKDTGEVRIVHEKCEHYYDLSGKIVRSVGMVHDVTELKQAVAALHAAHEQAAWLARFPDENPNPVVRVDADGQVLYKNPAAIKTPGWLCEEDQKLPAEILAVIQQTAENGAETEVDIDLCGRFYTLSVMPFLSDGYINVYARDITERRAAEAALAAAARKLEHSNRELEQFAFMASHDLQEPLRKIKSFGVSFQKTLQGRLDESSQDSLQRMLDATERMQAMIDDLLQLSRVNMQGRPFVQVDLAEVAAEVVSDLESRIRRTGGQVMVGALPVVEADPIQIYQALQNLIGNGLKFHKPGTPPVVKVSGSLTQSQNDKGEIVSINVEDNGIGFEEGQFEEILQPFRRLHSRSEYEGTGIGLAIVKKIIERHHGEISARSTPGEGSTFTITLPARAISA